MEVSSLPHPGGGLLPRSKRVLAAFGDERLVDQLRRGNAVAFEVLYDRHHRAILSFCRHMLSSHEEAEDAVQQTFISAYNDLAGSDKEIKLKAWLFTIARNRCLSILRARREEAAELDEIPTAGLSQQVQQREDLRRMLADLRELPEQQRAALVLSELGDLSHAEIANVVGCETMKVKSLVFQARSSLLESRDARDIPCEEIREQLATLRGGALRRGPIRKHLNVCDGCREFREDVRRQRAAMAALLPVMPSAGLKAGIMGAIGGGGAAGGGALGLGAGGTALAGGGAAAGGSAGLGGIVSIIAGGGITKVAVAAVIATGAAGGGVVAIDKATSSGGGGERGSGAPMADRQPGEVARPGKFTSIGIAGPGGEVATLKRHDPSKESPAAGVFVDNNGNPTPGEPRGNANGQDKSGSKDSKADGYYFVEGPGRSASRGNAQGSNGTRSRSRGNGTGGSDRSRPVPPRSPRSPNAGQPAPAPSTPSAAPSAPNSGGRDKAPKIPKGTRGDRGPKLPELPDLTLP
jgi:RNA polymerase sigma factor (sigma-70 family)